MNRRQIYAGHHLKFTSLFFSFICAAYYIPLFDVSLLLFGTNKTNETPKQKHSDKDIDCNKIAHNKNTSNSVQRSKVICSIRRTNPLTMTEMRQQCDELLNMEKLSICFCVYFMTGSFGSVALMPFTEFTLLWHPMHKQKKQWAAYSLILLLLYDRSGLRHTLKL